ncbi:MAG TPA: cyclopropane-fatty-acyl-phospholipid synthase family protein [Dermatophilaceae bacterium]|nr:cyclopropane-fatty-acyl-phospholipid synthase family protein [Dermatophilaceae bacterium]
MSQEGERTQTLPPAVATPVAATLSRVVEPLFPAGLPVQVRTWDGGRFGPPGTPTVHITSPDALRRLAWRPGELGLAQAYATGEIAVDGDLLDAFRRVWRAVRSQPPRRPAVTAIAKAALDLRLLGLAPAAPASQADLRGRLHSLRRDRAAIAHHYDLSNDFYHLLLDPHRAYSCAYWRSEDPAYTLADAQRDKLDLVCRKLGLRPGQRLLDIGCGWGSLTVYAAEHHGVDVVGVTLSEQQRRCVQQRVDEGGLGDRVEVRLQDYRDVHDGPFDAVSAIEMGEHVGRRNYPVFLRRVHDLLRPAGRVLIQQMSRRSRPGGGPFIEAFIAPDMHMRPVGQTVELVERAGLEVRDVHGLREHYVRTVQAWYDAFEERIDEVVALVGEEGARVWRLYLVGGALAFEEGRMGVDQILAVRREPGGGSGMPAVRVI